MTRYATPPLPIFARRSREIAQRRGVTVEITEIARHPAVPCAAAMQSRWRRQSREAGIAPFYLASGAGHDAEQFAGLTDIGMLFVRCGNGGISHNPLETVTATTPISRRASCSTSSRI